MQTREDFLSRGAEQREVGGGVGRHLKDKVLGGSRWTHHEYAFFLCFHFLGGRVSLDSSRRGCTLHNHGG